MKPSIVYFKALSRKISPDIARTGHLRSLLYLHSSRGGHLKIAEGGAKLSRNFSGDCSHTITPHSILINLKQFREEIETNTYAYLLIQTQLWNNSTNWRLVFRMGAAKVHLYDDYFAVIICGTQ